MKLFLKKSIHDVKINLSREEILRRSRILIVDDEKPEIINDLKKARFSVDYEPDINNENMNIIDQSTYDLILLDFGNVGKSFGADEGLSLLRHIKRVNPAIIVLSYTSKALPIAHADFYRHSDGVLAKDAGIADSLEKIEEGLKKAHSIENVWLGLITLAGIAPESEEDKKFQDLLVSGFHSKRKLKTFKQNMLLLLDNGNAKAIGNILIGKLIELGFKAIIGL
jgi:CheY-like chemotaxis protein